MSPSQTIKHYLGVGLLFLWGGVLLYFYATGRIMHYLPPDEGFHYFRTQCLIGGVVLCVIGAFNLLMSRREESCSHEHGHADDHDHDHEREDDAPDQARPHTPEPARPDSHEPDPDRVKPHSPGPDHNPPPTPDLAHAHAHSHDDHDHDHANCGHDHSHDHEKHSHATHDHDHGCCGHDHSHNDHAHQHKLEPSRPTHSHAHGCCGHDHGKDEGNHNHAVAHIHGDQPLPQFMISVLLLAVPLAYSAMKSPDAFSMRALENKGVYQTNAAVNPAAAAKYDLNNKQQPKTGVADLMAEGKANKAAAPVEKFSIKDLDAQVKKTTDGNYVLEVPELFLSTADREVRDVLDGLGVETVGQILPEKVNNPNGTRLRIMRLYVQCCAADATPMAFALEFGKTPPSFKERTWAKVKGKMSYQFEGGVTVPVLMVEDIQETAALDEGMAY